MGGTDQIDENISEYCIGIWEKNGTGFRLHGCLFLCFKIIGFCIKKTGRKIISQLYYKREIINVY